MARRKKTSPLEDLIEVLSLLPWWVCVVLGLISYLALHALARPVAMTGIRPDQIGQAMTQAVWKGLANVGQYLVPIVCFGAAVMSAIGRRKRRDLLSGIAQSSAADALQNVTWKEFELLVGEAFRLQGYRVTETGGNGPDGGVDLVIHKDREKLLVQCKQWKAFKVGVQPVRELYGVMAAEGASGGFVVTSGRFTEEAMAFASGRNVTLLDGPKLFGLIKQAKASLSSAVKTPTPPKRQAGTSSNPSVQPLRDATSNKPPNASSAPSCPVCAQSMVWRTAKRGSNAGSAFWGCSGYPACKGTRAVETA